jgi:hypothetical protein
MITSTKTNFHYNLASNYDHNHLKALHARHLSKYKIIIMTLALGSRQNMMKETG